MNKVESLRDKEVIQQFKDKLRHQSYRNYFMFVFGINSGLRIMDFLPLKVSDVANKSELVIIEQKTQKVREIPVNATLRAEINEYIRGMKPNDYLFASPQTGKPISRVMAYKILHKVAHQLGIEHVGCHTLRKTTGYWIYQDSKDIKLVQKIFGHTSEKVTEIYIGIDKEEVKKAYNKLDI